MTSFKQMSLTFSYQTKPVCSSAITALCAMGMITSDNRISAAALKEMPKLTDANYTMDIHLLTCLSMLITVSRIDSNDDLELSFADVN